MNFFKESTIEMIILGKPIEVKVKYRYENDQNSPDFDYGSKEENAKEMARFDSGELLNLCLVVKVSAFGETATDYLGQCFVNAKTVESELLEIAQDHEMVGNACDDLNNFVVSKYSEFQNVFGA